MKIPYGYERHPKIAGSLVTNESEQEVLRLIHELRETGLSMRQIVDELNRRGVPLVRKGNKWHLK